MHALADILAVITQWIRKRFAVRSSRSLVRMTKAVIRRKGDMLAPREAEQAQVRIDACEHAIRLNSLHEIRTSRKALAVFFEDNLRSYGKSSLRQNMEALVVAVALALLIRSFVVQPFKIPSGSMIPTLLVGDHILVNKFIYGVRIPLTDYKFPSFYRSSEICPGDVVVFKKPVFSGDQAFYVKRTIGVAGDEIDIDGLDILVNRGDISRGCAVGSESEEKEEMESWTEIPQTYSGDNPISVCTEEELLKEIPLAYSENNPVSVCTEGESLKEIPQVYSGHGGDRKEEKKKSLKKIPLTYSGDFDYTDGSRFYYTDKYSQSLSGNGFSVIYEKGNKFTTRGEKDFPLSVPEGFIFVMGDNRDNSLDSRFWGFVPVEKVYGKVFLVHWSWNFSEPGLLDKVRWGRVFSRVR